MGKTLPFCLVATLVVLASGRREFLKHHSAAHVPLSTGHAEQHLIGAAQVQREFLKRQLVAQVSLSTVTSKQGLPSSCSCAWVSEVGILVVGQ